MIVWVIRRDGSLKSATNREAESSDQRETAYDKPRCKEDRLLAVQRTTRPKGGILFEHGPYDSFDSIVQCGIEDDRSAEGACTAQWKSAANGALYVPRADALPDSEGGSQCSMPCAVWWVACRKCSPKEEAYKIISLVLGCREGSKLHLPG